MWPAPSNVGFDTRHRPALWSATQMLPSGACSAPVEMCRPSARRTTESGAVSGPFGAAGTSAPGAGVPTVNVTAVETGDASSNASGLPAASRARMTMVCSPAARPACGRPSSHGANSPSAAGSVTGVILHS